MRVLYRCTRLILRIQFLVKTKKQKAQERLKNHVGNKFFSILHGRKALKEVEVRNKELPRNSVTRVVALYAVNPMRPSIKTSLRTKRIRCY